MRRVVLIGALALAGGLLGQLLTQAVVMGQVALTSGAAGTFDAATATDEACTTSTTFVDLPGMLQGFKMSGAGSAVVLFQGRWFGNTSNVGRIRISLVVDTVPIGDVGMWTLQGGTLPGPPFQINGSSGMNFVTDSLTTGPHIAAIQWRSQFGQEVCVGRRNLIILHR